VYGCSAGSLVPPPGTYDDYVADFVKQVKPNLLSTDHYPDFSPEANAQTPFSAKCSDATNKPKHCKNKAGYIENMLSLRKAGLAANPPIGFWNFFNSVSRPTTYVRTVAACLLRISPRHRQPNDSIRIHSIDSTLHEVVVLYDS
jgi:hypothetical protein